MKKNPLLTLLIICGMLIHTGKLYSQKKDTLHIYYAGIEDRVLDSNDVKITKWAKSLNKKHHNIELYTYYDKPEFKKYMTERLKNLHTVVVRKARDFTTIKNMECVKGEKSQRIVADIVYISTDAIVAAEAAVKAEKEAKIKEKEHEKALADSIKAEEKKKKEEEKAFMAAKKDSANKAEAALKAEEKRKLDAEKAAAKAKADSTSAEEAKIKAAAKAEKEAKEVKETKEVKDKEAKTDKPEKKKEEKLKEEKPKKEDEKPSKPEKEKKK